MLVVLVLVVPVVAPWQALVVLVLVVLVLVVAALVALVVPVVAPWQALVALAPWQALEPVDVMQTCSWNSFFWLGVILI